MPNTAANGTPCTRLAIPTFWCGTGGFGATHIGKWGSLRDDLPNVGFFMDVGGEDSYPAHCPGVGNDGAGASPRQWPSRGLRGEAGAGIDGRFASPFATGRLVGVGRAP